MCGCCKLTIPFGTGGIILVISCDLISSCSIIAILYMVSERREKSVNEEYFEILKNSQPKNINIETIEMPAMTQKAIVGEHSYYISL
jgi:hypothetical protein